MKETTIEDVLKKHLVETNDENIIKNVVKRWEQFKKEVSTEAILAAMTEYASLNRQGWTDERKFSLEEMKQCWMDAFGFAGKEAYKTKGFIHPIDAIRDYFKNKFNIDV